MVRGRKIVRSIAKYAVLGCLATTAVGAGIARLNNQPDLQGINMVTGGLVCTLGSALHGGPNSYDFPLDNSVAPQCFTAHRKGTPIIRVERLTIR